MQYGLSPLHLAAVSGSLPVVRFLLIARANVNAMQARLLACRVCVRVRMRMRARARVVWRRCRLRRSMCHVAASHALTHAQWACARVSQKTGMTPLSLAVLHKAEDVVDLLLESGADCRCATARGVATRQRCAAQHATHAGRAAYNHHRSRAFSALLSALCPLLCPLCPLVPLSAAH